MNESEFDKAKIIKALEEKGATNPCPRCGRQKFAVIDGYFLQSIQKNLKGFSIGGPAVPSIVAACANCGFISQHAIGALLQPSAKKDEAKENAQE